MVEVTSAMPHVEVDGRAALQPRLGGKCDLVRRFRAKVAAEQREPARPQLSYEDWRFRQLVLSELFDMPADSVVAVDSLQHAR